MLGRLTVDDGALLEAFLREFDADPSELHGYFCDRDAPVEVAVSLLDDWSRGEGLQPGWVPCTTLFWREEQALRGVLNIRHSLTDSLRNLGGHIGYAVAPSHRRKGVASAMLAAALDEARALGIEEALLTCDADNIGSRKTIERNGGRCIREGQPDGLERTQRWYTIDLRR